MRAVDEEVDRYLRCRALAEDPRATATEREAARRKMDAIRERAPDVVSHDRVTGRASRSDPPPRPNAPPPPPPPPAQAAGFDGPIGRALDRAFSAATAWAADQVADLFEGDTSLEPDSKRASGASPARKRNMGKAKKQLDRSSTEIIDLLEDDSVCGLEVDEGEADDGEVVYTVTMDIPVDVWKRIAKNGPGRKALTDWISAAIDELAPLDDDTDEEEEEEEEEEDDDE